jgi:hypothetical protein
VEIMHGDRVVVVVVVEVECLDLFRGRSCASEVVARLRGFLWGEEANPCKKLRAKVKSLAEVVVGNNSQVQ